MVAKDRWRLVGQAGTYVGKIHGGEVPSCSVNELRGLDKTTLSSTETIVRQRKHSQLQTLRVCHLTADTCQPLLFHGSRFHMWR
jgi:hypothetical protein